MVAYFREFEAITTSVRETQRVMPPNPDLESGWDLEAIESDVSGEAVRIIRPDRASDLRVLMDWVNERFMKLSRGESVTIALDTESAGSEPICIQLGDLYNDDFDPFAPRDSDVDCPPVGAKNGLIVFLIDQSGKRNYGPARLLSAFLNHKRITIATFDCTVDLTNLETVGIRYQRDRVIDCQLYGLPRRVEYLKYTRVNGLGFRVECMAIDDPLLGQAQEIVQAEKSFPWDATLFVLKLDKLPVSEIVTRGFLEYSANDIALTGLAFTEIVREGKIDEVMSQSREKLMEYERAQSDFGVKGPYMVRQASLCQRGWLLLKSNCFNGGNTESLLDRWRRFNELEETECFADGRLFRLDVQPNEIASKMQAIEKILKEKERQNDVRFLAKVVQHETPRGQT
jgi:hypothetical protein